MIDCVMKAWDKNSDKLKAVLQSKFNGIGLYNYGYDDLIRWTLETIFDDDSESLYTNYPMHNLITEVDYGDYQGTRVYIIGGNGYQPGISNHYYTHTYYGSCSGCDTLQSIIYDDIDTRIDGLFTLCLHLMQKLKRLSDD